MALCPKTNQPENDLVMTPPAMAEAIVRYLQPSGICLDPCRGEGAFYDAFKEFTDLREWCEITEGKDFLNSELPQVEWVITNPPWSKIAQFMERAFDIAQNVVLLATVTNFVTRKRLEIAEQHGFGLTEFLLMDRPKSWSPTGFQVAAAVYRGGEPNLTRWTRLSWG